MIISNKGDVQIEGTTVDLLAEATSILRHLYQHNILTMEDYNLIGELLPLSTEELDQKVQKSLNKLAEERMPELIMGTLSGDKNAAFLLNQYYNRNKATEKEGKSNA